MKVNPWYKIFSNSKYQGNGRLLRNIQFLVISSNLESEFCNDIFVFPERSVQCWDIRDRVRPNTYLILCICSSYCNFLNLIGWNLPLNL